MSLNSAELNSAISGLQRIICAKLNSAIGGFEAIVRLWPKSHYLIPHDFIPHYGDKR